MNIFHKVTLETLKKNRTRTFVTVIGIVLSIAMFTAVTTSISSLRNYLLQVVIEQNGSWHGVIMDMNASEVASLKTKDEVKDVVSIQNIGYAKLANSKNEDKPYLFIGGIEKNITDLLPVTITKGRMPQTGGEILIPDHLKANGGVTFSIGDVLTLDIGVRVSDGNSLNQLDSYMDGKEKWIARETRTYTVTGLYSRPSFESFSAPGYTALVLSDHTGTDSYDSYFHIV